VSGIKCILTKEVMKKMTDEKRPKEERRLSKQEASTSVTV
jgi:hypothetical protein